MARFQMADPVDSVEPTSVEDDLEGTRDFVVLDPLENDDGLTIRRDEDFLRDDDDPFYGYQDEQEQAFWEEELSLYENMDYDPEEWD